MWDVVTAMGKIECLMWGIRGYMINDQMNAAGVISDRNSDKTKNNTSFRFFTVYTATENEPHEKSSKQTETDEIFWPQNPRK